MRKSSRTLERLLSNLPERRNEPEGVEVTTRVPLDKFLPFRLHRLSTQLTPEHPDAFTVGRYQLSVRQWRLLVLLANCGPLNNAEMAQFANMNAATISRALARLTDLGLLISQASPSDKRKTMISLTAQGATVYNELASRRMRTIQQIETCLSPRELALFFDVLDKLETQILASQNADADALDWSA